MNNRYFDFIQRLDVYSTDTIFTPDMVWRLLCQEYCNDAEAAKGGRDYDNYDFLLLAKSFLPTDEEKNSKPKSFIDMFENKFKQLNAGNVNASVNNNTTEIKKINPSIENINSVVDIKTAAEKISINTQINPQKHFAKLLGDFFSYLPSGFFQLREYVSHLSVNFHPSVLNSQQAQRFLEIKGEKHLINTRKELLKASIPVMSD